MKHFKALTFKGIMTVLFLFAVLWFGFGVSFGSILILSVILGAVSYLSGDLFILPKKKNMVATIADFGLTFIIILLSGMWFLSLSGSVVLAAFISALLVSVGEYYFHLYLADHVLPANNRQRTIQ